MLSQPLKDTTVIFWNQGRSFSAGAGSKLRSAKDLPDVFFQMVSQGYWSTGTSLHPTARAHHCVTTTTLWALLGHYPFHPNADIGPALSGAGNSSGDCQQRRLREQWSRSQSMRTSKSYNYGQNPFTAKHHNSSLTEVCEKVHTALKSSRIW